MDWNDTPEQAAFRGQVSSLIAERLPRRYRDLAARGAMPERAWENDRKSSDPVEYAAAIDWHAALAERHWVAPHWPSEYGGGGLTPMEQFIFNQEIAEAGAPGVGGSGVNMLGPTLIVHGSDEQKAKYLPPILDGNVTWAQGYSEPGSGSDLASLTTRAVRDGDDFIINGQKIWTSAAHTADAMFALVRTDPDAPKHRGISYILVNMKTPGVTVRPLVLMNGHSHFNEVFFEDVRVPKVNLVGPLNQGWKVAMTTLMFERAYAGVANYDDQIGRLVELSQQVHIDGEPAWEQSWVRQKLTEFHIESQALKYTRLRGLTKLLKGLPPGPEGSMLKLCGSELGIDIAAFASELLAGAAITEQTTDVVPDAPRWFNRVLSARQYTIAGGTSEIQKNIMGERVLGLPKG